VSQRPEALHAHGSSVDQIHEAQCEWIVLPALGTRIGIGLRSPVIDDQPIAMSIMRRRSAQQATLLIGEFCLKTLIGREERLFADSGQQPELHQLNNHSLAL
jgi:hypothetical protein